jgi:hypothetical protein
MKKFLSLPPKFTLSLLLGLLLIFAYPIAGYFLIKHFYPGYQLFGAGLGVWVAFGISKIQQSVRKRVLTQKQKIAIYCLFLYISDRAFMTEDDLNFLSRNNSLWGVNLTEVNSAMKEHSIEDFTKEIGEMHEREKYQCRDLLLRMIGLNEEEFSTKRSLYEVLCLDLRIRPYDSSSDNSIKSFNFLF